MDIKLSQAFVIKKGSNREFVGKDTINPSVAIKVKEDLRIQNREFSSKRARSHREIFYSFFSLAF